MNDLTPFNPCADCESVAHCEGHGCIPKRQGPAPQRLIQVPAMGGQQVAEGIIKRRHAAQAVEAIMTQAQVFASAWSLVGGPFDKGSLLEEAEQTKAELRGMVAAVVMQEPPMPDLVDWVVGRWQSEVANRPLVNIHRRSLDDTWRQVLRRLGVDDRARLGPTHDELIAPGVTDCCAVKAVP